MPSVLVLRFVVALLLMLAVMACESTPTPAATATPTTTPPSNVPTSTPTPSPTDTPSPEPSRTLRGVSLSPASYEQDDFVAFMELAAELDVLRWAGGWPNLQSPSSAAGVIATLAEQYDFDAMVATDVYSADARELFVPLTAANQTAFVDAVTGLVTQHRVPYLSLGVEINSHYESDPDSFATYVDLFDRAYDAVKAASPETQVFVTFQLERLRGLQGGLFGGVNDPSLASWDLIDRFPKADFIGFTTYPGLIYGDPDELADDYYAEIAEHTSKPVAFTEIGWTTETVAPGWEADEAEQVRFIERFDELVEPLSPKVAVWFWLFEQQGTYPLPFKGMTLFRPDGTPKPGWDAWKDGG